MGVAIGVFVFIGTQAYGAWVLLVVAIFFVALAGVGRFPEHVEGDQVDDADPEEGPADGVE